jgi:hypothetical protein
VGGSAKRCPAPSCPRAVVSCEGGWEQTASQVDLWCPRILRNPGECKVEEMTEGKIRNNRLWREGEKIGRTQLRVV